jgi:hypothetical protein
MSMEKPVKIQICIFRNDTLGKLKGRRTKQTPEIDTIHFELPLLYNLGSHGQIVVIGADDVDNVESMDNLVVEIPVGKYTPKSLVEKFRQALAAQVATIERSVKRPFHHLMELTFDEMKNRVCSESLHQVLIFYYQEDDASSLFGLPKLTDKKFSKEFHLGKYEFPLPPLVKVSKSLFIYTDIIDNDLVGDALVPLLRTVDILDDLDVIVHKSFDLSYYKRVIRSVIPSIEIQINSETGALVNFESGEVICLLHFRKVSNKR